MNLIERYKDSQSTKIDNLVEEYGLVLDTIKHKGVIYYHLVQVTKSKTTIPYDVGIAHSLGLNEKLYMELLRQFNGEPIDVPQQLYFKNKDDAENACRILIVALNNLGMIKL